MCTQQAHSRHTDGTCKIEKSQFIWNFRDFHAYESVWCALCVQILFLFSYYLELLRVGLKLQNEHRRGIVAQKLASVAQFEIWSFLDQKSDLLPKCSNIKWCVCHRCAWNVPAVCTYYTVLKTWKYGPLRFKGRVARVSTTKICCCKLF